MDSDKVINVVVDLVNGEIDNNIASDMLRKELASSATLSIEEQSCIVEMVENYTSADELPRFIEEVSLMLSESDEVLDYVSRNND